MHHIIIHPTVLIGASRPLAPELTALARLVWLALALAWPSARAWSADVAPEVPVGRLGTNLWLTPVNQFLTPAGRQLQLPKLRPQALALSPNGRWLVTAGKTAELVVVDPATGTIRQRVPLPADKLQAGGADAVSAHILEPDTDGQVSFTGLVFSPEGARLYLANVNGTIKVFGVAANGVVFRLSSLPLPHADAPRRKAEIPAGLANDYLERSFAGFPRSYPDGLGLNEIDAMAYSSAGFIWDNAIAHGKTLRVYGEFSTARTAWTDPARTNKPVFLDHYRNFVEGGHAIDYRREPNIESLRPHLATNTIGWQMNVPDVLRAARFIEDLQQFEQSGKLPALTLLYLPNDHTSGTKAGWPTPAAQVADNDLAVGQVVEALTRSRFWKETCLLAIEDDPQNGWDHVSGYRTTAYVVSPYTSRGKAVSTRYNQTSLLRTLELILGLPPMNQMDATATPMADCFTDTSDFTPFTAVTNQVPLDQLNPAPKEVADPLLRKLAYASARLPLEQPDQCPEDRLNRILWHALKGPQAPYPQWAVQLVPDDD
jgi:DNA-binding beta-propeller fold protein YncE